MKQLLLNRIAWAALALAFPISALADLSATKTLSSNTNLNLDSGATATGSGGDVLWNGTTITPQGNAKAFSIGPLGSLTGITKSIVDAVKPAATSAAIPASSLTTGNVFAVFTNGGNSAAVLVNSNASGSITLQFTTFGATGGGGGGGPTITNILNNSSDIPAGFPNSGIAQGSLFKVLGSGLAAGGDATLHDSQAAGGLPTTLNGATITVTATGGVTKTPAMYYATPTQLVGVMPSSTPAGPATVTVSYNNATSNSFQIQIVAAAPGITTYNGAGVAQHALLGTLVTYTDSAKPGEVLIIWGTGYGATANSDTRYDTSGNQTSVPYNIYIGGVQANVAYKGASVYPGVGVFGVTIPANVQTGCYVSVAAVANGTVVSNIVTLPIAANGGACSDPQFGITGNQIPAAGQPLKSGFVIVSQQTAPTGVTNSAVAFFQQTAGVSSPGGGAITSIGGCVLTQITTGGSAGTVTGLNAGTITVTGPGGSPVTLTGIPQLPGVYAAQLASIPSTGGAYVFNGTAGSQVGAFTATVNFPNPLLAWTNQSVAATVARNQALTVTWNGGAPGSYVIISGSSSNTGSGVTGSYSCFAPQSALTFTVPSYVLLGLPAGTGTTSVQNSTNLTPFTASGIDGGNAFGNVSFSVNTTYN